MGSMVSVNSRRGSRAGQGLRTARCVLVAALAILGCGPSPAETPFKGHRTRAAASSERRQSFTYSPRSDSDALPETNACGVPDRGLREVAQSVLELYEQSGVLPTSELLSARLREAGLPYVWVRAWAATGVDLDAVTRELRHWTNSSSTEGHRRCGLAVSRSSHAVKAVALMVDVLVDVSPVPRLGRVGQWFPLEAQLHTEVVELSLLALGPRGLPHEMPVHVSPDGTVSGQLRLGSPGRWLFQLLPTTSSGPRPAAEIEVFAGDAFPRSDETEPVPGEHTRACASDECDALLMTAMANAARESEKLPLLVRSHTLETLAVQHAEAMRDKNQLAHDLGDGDPYARTASALGSPQVVGENVAHADSALAAHRALWRSPAHRQNLLRREYTHIGIGVAHGTGGDIWACQLFAAEEEPATSY